MTQSAAFTAGVAAFLAGCCLPAYAGAPSCDVTQADLQRNAALSFDDFDQKGTAPATWRQLSNRGCNRQAALTAEDYLVHAKLASVVQQHDVLFQIAQSLAEDGQNEQAAMLVAASKDPTQPSEAAFDWNTYLDGTWAFLARRRPDLALAYARLGAETGHGNAVNTTALGGLLRCFDRPYAIAYSGTCRASH